MEWRELSSNSIVDLVDIDDIDENHSDSVFVGGDLSPATLIRGYSIGIFPMFVPEYKRFRKPKKNVLAWYYPKDRGIVPIDNFHTPKSVKRYRKRFELKTDTCFREVITQCKDMDRPDVWLNDEFVESYTQLHEFGLAHSFEVYFDSQLVGGVYGVNIGGYFSVESMFHSMPHASKVGFIYMMETIRDAGVILCDVQWVNAFTSTIGAISVSRREFAHQLRSALELPDALNQLRPVTTM